MENIDLSQSVQLPPALPQVGPVLPLPPLPPGNPYQVGVMGYYQPRPRKPPVWTVFVVLLIAVIAYLGASFAAAAIYASLAHPQEVSSDESWRESVVDLVKEPGAIAALALGSQLAFLGVSVAAAVLSPMGIVRRLRIGKSTLSWVGYITLPVGILSVNFLFQSLVRLLPIQDEGGTLKVLHDVFTQLSPGMVGVMAAVIGIMPGFAEEFLFRGYVQTRLEVRWGRLAAILVASALFGLMHFDKIQSPATFLMGLYLGYAASRAGSIRPSMFAHAFNNTAVVLVTWYLARHAKSGDSTPNVIVSHAAVMLQVLGWGVMVALCFLYLRFRVTPPVESETYDSERRGELPEVLRFA